MAIDSSVARFSGAQSGTIAQSSGSFTAALDSILLLCGHADSAGSEPFTLVASDSGGLTWTKLVERTAAETTGGGACAWFWARVTAAVSRTVSIARSANSTGTLQLSGKVYILTGYDADGTLFDAITANNEGGSLTNSITTTAITAGADGTGFAGDTDWAALGAFDASADLTQDTVDIPGAISVCSGYKAVISGASVTMNLNAAGSAAAQHKWVTALARLAAAAGAAAVSQGQMAVQQRMG